MISFALSEIASIIGAEWIGQDRIIETVTIDSRKITQRCLFVALEGHRFDGHHFISQAVFNGAYAVLVHRYSKLEVPQLIVEDTRRAFSQLAAWVRRQVSCKIIAITGSSGKTSVKEMTASILSQRGKIVVTQENFNNDIGVSLTLLCLTNEDDFAVIELGSSSFGEIAWSSSLVFPDIVLVNNIFSSHLSGFGSLVGVAIAKGEIFSSLPNSGVCVLNADNNACLLWKHLLLYRKVVYFSLQRRDKVDFFASSIVYSWNSISFILHTPLGSAVVTLLVLGKHSVSNALAASVLAFFAGATLQEIVLGLEKVRPLPGRLFPIVLGIGKLLLDDSYNANVGSMIASIDVLNRMAGYRVIVVGDMLELGGLHEVQCHRDIGKFIAVTNIHQVFSIGCMSCFISYYSGRGEHFYSYNMLISRIVQVFKMHDRVTVLIKGSRSMLMDQLVMVLREILYGA
ncbi:UDP-N-acetylmuramoyl-tripeptide--D-alanyl-D-alanine ligase [Blochmannia endosymbiont of Polyrhachis (Hedomyrma) turneri]|uniref:UDP-N-acetylmuramoyl-tripeptide--D-alanyl-D- alanine ligase n=1 Tax=Blochmannia endosymbiont of Polyrhachis (Hedomyrma) turneri TaxID=1505596 RepID=UPI00061A84F7|nr:UDP-N-acetylmuramoyl-tripeptide--D-alanyl-D-alanine ligase [Blochmannia endosymbiont of Polyrhachis (Hedomyrma) turneri]AKC59721.1 UDP-N-acetylmuramoyl-tripeptide--D-alanyl-D-alanine ligase [Blochmannia endosymbiont of Polyrhachis (Hedomyrma) turneri]